MQVNILEAKRNLSNLVRMIETGEEETVIIARHGKPVVKITLYQDTPVSRDLADSLIPYYEEHCIMRF